MTRPDFTASYTIDSALSIASSAASYRKDLISRLRLLAEQMWSHPLYEIVLLALSAFFVLMNAPIVGCAILATEATFMLIFCSDILALLPSLLFACVLACETYEDFGALLEYKPVLIVPLLALIAHFCLYRTPIRTGKMTVPFLLISLAALMGGIGRISPEEYFAPVSLYYVFGLGVCLLLAYTFLYSDFHVRRNYHLLSRFLKILFFSGVLAGVVIFNTYLVRWDEFMAAGSSIFISYRNYCATVLMMALPCTCLFRENGKALAGGFAFLYLSMLFTASRTALVFGTFELILCLVWCYRKASRTRRANMRRIGLLLAPFVVTGVVLLAKMLFEARLIDGQFISPTDSRYFFIKLGIQDFVDAPLFGQGLGNMKNSVVFYGVDGSLVWYNNIVLQVMGCLGIFGLISYGWMWLSRLQLVLTKRSAELEIAALSWLGIVMVNMTNPGEVCPLPNALIMVVLFAIIETLPDKKSAVGMTEK